MNLSPLKRLELIRLINALPDPEFDEMAFALNPRGGIVPPSEAAQGRRGKALLEWVEGPTGCGMAAFLELFNAIAPGKFEPASLISQPKPHAPASAVTLKQTASPQSQPVAPSSKANPSLTLALGFGVSLELVYIPGGRFWMGSPKTEEGRDIYQLFNKSLTNVEGPQHEVTVPAFYMGKYLVTQRSTGMELWSFANTYQAIPGSIVACPVKPNGNMPVGQALTVPFTLGKRSVPSRPTIGVRMMNSEVKPCQVLMARAS